VAEHDNPAGVANWVIHELLRELKERPLHELPLDAAGLAELVRLVDAGELSSTGAKQVFEVMVRDGGRPRAIVEERGLRQVSDEAELAAKVTEVVAAHPDEAARYRGGEARLHGWFVGQVMRATGGAANPQLVNRLLRETLAG
jgi:glutaminyl-tRNA synthetase